MDVPGNPVHGLRILMVAAAIAIGVLLVADRCASDRPRTGDAEQDRSTRESSGPVDSARREERAGAPSLRIAVSTRDGDRCAPAAGVWVRVQPATEGVFLSPSEPPTAEATTDEKGRAVLTPGRGLWQVAVGRHDLKAVCDTWDGREEGLEFELERVDAIRIRVVDRNGKPVSGAEVLRLEAPPLSMARTDAAGVFSLAANGVDRYLIRRAGYATTRVHGWTLQETRLVSLRPGLPLAGVVVDEEGDPVVGASLRLDEEEFECRHLSDPEGRFAFDGIPMDRFPGGARVDLLASREGYLPNRVSVIPGDRDLRVALRRPRTASGRVTLPDGSPAAGLTVEAGADGVPGRWHWRAYTDEAGRFRIEGLPPGPIRLETFLWRAHPEVPERKVRVFGAARTVVMHPDGPDPEIALLLEPVPTSFVSLEGLGPDGRSLGRLGSDQVLTEFGSVAVSYGSKPEVTSYPFPPGTPVRVTVQPSMGEGVPPGLGRVRRTVLTTASPTDPPTAIRMPAPTLLKVRVRDAAGKPLAVPTRIHVTDVPGETEFAGEETRPGERGFVVPAGTMLLVTAWASDHGPEYRRHEKAEVPDALKIRLRGTGRIRGRLVMPPGEERRILDVFEELKFWGVGLEPGPDGSFDLKDVPARRIKIATTLDGVEILIRVVDVEPGEVVDLGEIRVNALPRLTGRVSDLSGRPLPALATLWSRKGYEAVGTAAAAPDGRFELPFTPVPDGWVEVSAPRMGRAFFAATTRLTGPLEVRLRPEGRIRLRLKPEMRWPDITVTLPGGVATWHPPVESALGPDGRPCRLLRELPDGPLTITVARWRDGKRTVAGETEVDVVAGEVRDVTMAVRSR